MNVKEELKQRLCIYVTYHKQQKIEPYIRYMLRALRKCCTTLYVVCNYEQILEGEKYLTGWADKIFLRENKGYDAGAYKDMLCTLIGWEEVSQYDELLLTNDSFLGPFWELKNYFHIMTDVVCDFWGLTRQFEGKLEEIEYNYQSHVQSYFLVFRRQVFSSIQFRRFWEDFEYPKTFIETVLNYEIKINEYLVQQGFISKALTDVWGLRFEGKEIAYCSQLHSLLKNYSFPILKKKSLLVRNPGFADVLSAVEFIKAQTSYPVEWINNLIDNQFYIENYAPEGVNCLEFFCEKYRRIYIYGAGVCGKNLTIYFERKGWQYAGVLVTDKRNQSIKCEAFNDISIDDDTGIIISAVHQKMSDEIAQQIGEKCRKKQLFKLCDCLSLKDSN